MQNTVVEVTFNIVDRFIENQISVGKSDFTAKTYHHALEAFDKYLKANGGSINDLTRHDVQLYISYLEYEGKSASTVNKVFDAISVFAKFIKKPQIIEDIRIVEARKVRNIAPKWPRT